MSNFEPIVRPFQERQIAPGFLILDDTKVDDPIAQSIGSEGGITFDFSYNFSGSAKSSTGDEWKETSRKSESVRVENPDDSEQFVQIKRAKSIKFNNVRDGRSQRSYDYNYPDSKSN